MGRYLILEELGRGGMGVVWTAYDPKLDRKVAIKRLHRSQAMNVRQVRFIREAQALARLNHPNIVTVHDVDAHERQLYMAMEYVDGQTLECWLSMDSHDWRSILRIFDQAGRGLAAAHAAGITHRDFKPSNMLITSEGNVKVFDFGLAKYIDDDSKHLETEALPEGEPAREDPNLMEMIGTSNRLKITKFGRFVGTPAYMAPEQYPALDGHPIGAWTDQFSFSVTLYESLYGERPFEGEDLLDIYANARAGRIREPPRGTVVPGWIYRVLHRAMHYDPGRRYPSMEALLTALRTDPALRRRRLLTYASSAALLGLASFGMLQAATAAPSPPLPCRGASKHLSGIWDEPKRIEVHQRMVATDLPFAADAARRTISGLDAYSDSWVAQHTNVCEATRIHGEQSESMLDVRMNCLERRRSELAALVKALTTPREQTVARSVAAVAGLRPAKPCALALPGVENDLPSDPVLRGEFMDLQTRIDDARALLITGRDAEARDLAIDAGRVAARREFERLHGEALVIEGQSHQSLRESTTAQARLRQGIAIAASVADIRTELVGWINLLYTTGVLLDSPREAAGLHFAAENALQRAGSPVDLASSLAVTHVAVLLEQRDLERAARVGEDALHTVLGSEGPSSLQYAHALTNLGIVAAQQSDWTLAKRRLRESQQLLQRLVGVDHPDVYKLEMNLANVLVQRAKASDDEDVATASFDEAEQLYRHVLAFREQSEGPSGDSVARTLANLGLLQSTRGKRADARRTLLRAVHLLRDKPSADVGLASILVNLGTIERREGRYDEAEGYYRQALVLQHRALGPEHTSAGQTRLHLCQLIEEARRPTDARTECERAREVLQANSEPRAHTLLLLAQERLAHLDETQARP